MNKFGMLVLLLGFILGGCTAEKPKPKPEPERTQIIIPDPPALISHSISATLYTTTESNAWTAVGQLFKVPEDHTYLTKFGVYGRQSASWRTNAKEDLKLVLRIAKWDGEKPESESLMVSEPAIVKTDFKHGWIYFDVPHISLNPKDLYVAWFSLTGQGNPIDSSIDIIEMRPYRPAPEYYKQQPSKLTIEFGKMNMVMWDQPNQSQSIEQMSKSAWRQEMAGVNIQTTMSFENKP